MTKSNDTGATSTNNAAKKLSLHTESVRNLGVRAGVRAGVTNTFAGCGSACWHTLISK